ncbi:MAG: hypothetical protein J4428_04020 [Candidatus Aenigmarchaeota archaeon]|nr:hypothetical protein [Candidatus Aenigmarchaeota archaeon]
MTNEQSDKITLYEWVLDRIPRPYELSIDVPGHWEQIEVAREKAQRLLRGGASWKYRTSLELPQNGVYSE